LPRSQSRFRLQALLESQILPPCILPVHQQRQFFSKAQIGGCV
jgi:hypothetical protein